MQRVIAYIDRFNLYFGLKSKGWRRFYRLNIQEMARRLLRPGQQLTLTRYYTSRVSAKPHDQDKPKRQNIYLEPLATLPDFTMRFGHYLQKTVKSPLLGSCSTTFSNNVRP